MNKIIHRNKTYYGQNNTIIIDNGNAYSMVSVLNENPNAAVIHDLAVHEGKRGKGLGTAILEASCEEANHMGADCIRLCVEPNSWVEKWYKRHGFKETGENEVICETLFTILEKPCGKK